jgi:XTP/dITP diphosphohydrolase
MDGVDDRRARFVCCLCLVEDGEITVEVEGRVDGQLLEIPRGSGGFGYDPLFVPDDDRAAGRTFAELSAAEKTAISHRGRAIEAFTAALSLRAEDGAPS